MLSFNFLPVILFLAFILLVVFTAYMIFGGASKLYDKLKNETSPKFLRENRFSLLHWETKRAFADMSSELKRRTETSTIGGSWAHSRGTVRSLSQRGKNWLAFTLNRRGGQGRIDLETSSTRYSLEYADRSGTFRVDGAALGHINADDEILDVNQHPIGRLHHQRSFAPMGVSYNTTVDIGGRTIAEVYYLSDFGDRLWKAPALVQRTPSSLSNDETWWIIAAIAMRLYAHCRTSQAA